LINEHVIDIIPYYSVSDTATYIAQTTDSQTFSDIGTEKNEGYEISTGCCFFCGHDAFNDILCPTCASNVES